MPGELEPAQVESMVDVALAAALNANNARQAEESDLVSDSRAGRGAVAAPV